MNAKRAAAMLVLLRARLGDDALTGEEKAALVFAVALLDAQEEGK